MNRESPLEHAGEGAARWDMDATRRLVWDVHGEDQARRAAPSVRSLSDRLTFAQWHYSDLQKVVSEFTSETLKDRSVLEFVAHEEKANDTFSAFMVRISAYVTAFVQTLHALEDIAAHMVYFSLALDQGSTRLKDREISGHRVQKLVSARAGCERLHSRLADFDHSREAKHLEALANLSKHRSIVIPRLTEDFTGQAPRYRITLSDVQYEGEQFPLVPFSEFAESEFHRASVRIVLLGNELNAVLRESRPAGAYEK